MGLPMARIVIADDELDLVEILSDILRDEGHDVQTALDGVSALGSIRAFHPDVAILDLDMPKMSGCRVVSALHEEGDGFADIPVVLLSGNANVKDIAREIGVGFSVTKPVQIDDLLAVVTAALDAGARSKAAAQVH